MTEISARATVQKPKKENLPGPADDAIVLLKSDHRNVEKLFKKFEAAQSAADKQQIARQICNELITHTQLEEEIFYPACREKKVEDDVLDEAQVEHDGAKILITDLMALPAESPYFDAKVTVLSEYIKHHVGEEENSSGGIFAKAKKAGVDMGALGQRLQARKQELKQKAETQGFDPPEPRALECFRQSPQQEQRNMHRQYDRDRDDQGRFTSDDDRNQGSGRSRGGYSASHQRDEDEDYRSSSRDGGRYSSRSSSDRERDDQGRFMGDGDYGPSHNGGSRDGGRYSSRSSTDRERDDQGRFMSDDDNGSSRGGDRYSSRSSTGRERDDHGRFMSDDDGNGRSSTRSSGRYGRDEGDNDGSSSRGGGGQGGNGDNDGHSRGMQRGREERGSPRYSREDEGRRGSHSGNGDHRGWYGDSRGHSEAAQRGWRHRE